MSDDDETTVRQRLGRLLAAGTSNGYAVPVGRPLGRPSALDPPDPPDPSTGPDPVTGVDGRALPAASTGLGAPDPLPAEDDLADRPRLAGAGVFDPGRRGVRALAAVAVLVVLAAAGWAWLSRPAAEPVPAASAAAATPEPAGASAASRSGPPPAPAGAGNPTEVVVAVAGKVRRPGLVRLPPGARVADAIEAAGGALPGVDVAMVNPARKVTDGELIVIGVTPPPAGAAGPVGGQSGAAGAGPGGKVNLNTATVAQIDALPGVGPVLAQRIIDYREQHGGFRSVGDLRQVTGIGDARYQDLKDLVTV
ncbi:helix-hairpin-helix domain-containing protein [Micromonospora zhanjiangensis]|uniref:Helix-hairpin-helix domain-containing protein n=1 Tax=Micromonospora zhanjiangensis TaxID=1522057 RepID=A0ABV8KVC6_9ACTN